MYIIHPSVGQFSIVQATTDGRPGSKPDPSRLVIRSRVTEHLRNLQVACPVLKPFPITLSDRSDYLARAVAPRQAVLEACQQLVELVRYPNAKHEAEVRFGAGSAFVTAMFSTWRAWLALQHPPRAARKGEAAWWEKPIERTDETEL